MTDGKNKFYLTGEILVSDNGRHYVEVKDTGWVSESSDINFYGYYSGVVWFWRDGKMEMGIPLDRQFWVESYPFDENGGI